MGGGTPKQFLSLNGKPVLRRAVYALQQDPRVEKLLVVVSPGDQQSQALLQERDDTALPSPINHKDHVSVSACGGASRAESVLNGLTTLLSAGASRDAWVLVHDAARPGLSRTALKRLLDYLLSNPQTHGAILAVPVADTVKRAKPDSVALPTIDATIARDQLWLAQTPQAFRIGLLHQVLSTALQQDPTTITDEASAMERAGYSVALIEGEMSNQKLTRPEDWMLLEALVKDNH